MIHVGCSGWQYRHWRGVFYPATLPAARWLEHYAEVFDTVGSGIPPTRRRALPARPRGRRQPAAGRRAVYAYFNNDIGGHAMRNARTLRRLLARALAR